MWHDVRGVEVEHKGCGVAWHGEVWHGVRVARGIA